MANGKRWPKNWGSAEFTSDHLIPLLRAILRSTSVFPGQPVLIELRLENYAVIDNLAVEFGAGLNLLTGETGAGKSILIDALALLLGEKASTEVIRFGADRALLSAVFEVEAASEKKVAEILAENGIDAEDGN